VNKVLYSMSIESYGAMSYNESNDNYYYNLWQKKVSPNCGAAIESGMMINVAKNKDLIKSNRFKHSYWIIINQGILSNLPTKLFQVCL
ncbi:hypothetical protein DERP_002071, partial [Dermatophagoides pteronyssinus]